MMTLFASLLEPLAWKKILLNLFNLVYAACKLINIVEFCYGVFGVTERYLKVTKIFFNLNH
jgi:hypothetical protein